MSLHVSRQLRLMCQFVNVLDVEVLPPYTPSAAERADASLYAANVRDLYAAQTGWPLVEQSQREFTALCKVGRCAGCAPAFCVLLTLSLQAAMLCVCDKQAGVAATASCSTVFPSQLLAQLYTLAEGFRFDWTGGRHSQPGWQAHPGATWHAGRADVHGPVQTHAGGQRQQSGVVHRIEPRHK